MALDAVDKSALKSLRKIALEFAREIGVIGAAAVRQRVIERDLAVREQQRQFRAGQAAAFTPALFDVVIVGQELDRAIEFAMTLEPAQQLLMLAQILDRAAFHEADRLALQIVVAQDQRCDLAGGRHQQPVTPAARDRRAGIGRIQQYFEVDLDIGSVDAGRIVDEIGINMAATGGVLDPPALGESEISAFPDHAGTQVRARVVGEGGNLGFSQRGRIEYAAGGGHINADFIDNSAGVNTSDVEVNLKILLDAPDAGAAIARRRRNRLLVATTGEVAALVLRNNYLQSQAISLMERRAVEDLSEHQQLLRWLERHGELDRAIEFLPDDHDIEQRRREGRGLTRPELALLLSYGKIALNHALSDSGSADDPYLARELERYFPQAFQRRFANRIKRHRLRRQIIITAATNSIVNRVGPTLLMQCAQDGDANAVAVARAYTLSLIHISEPTRQAEISYAVF